ncbi:glycosyltransferase family 4 protein [Panacibacter ginsenosidivorans]|uniref:Glycosyltransferase family 4 protein n=1 Tax=Panacibacter ginsenosidivorans TaxID=1813871 RepID=A0A5B8VC12_9BACT|nr:glycosyltransferase family 4 protein [Panacibacter ginsenosidivorans]QEC68565.1 glycosyltransferase family 4 protein [Panacibacter ginsenosidivorans]
MSDKKANILFFCSFPPPNTGQTIATKLIHDALADYYSIDVINIADENRFKRKSGAFSFSIVITLVKKFVELRKKLKTKSYDIVYVVFAPYTFSLLRDLAYTIIIKRSSEAVLIAHLHCGNYGDNFKKGIKKKLFDYLLQQTNKLIFLSPLLKHFKYPAEKTFFLTNMISADVVCTNKEVEEKLSARQNEGQFRIFFISNMIIEKGYEDLIAAAKILKQKNTKSFSVHLVGSWPSDGIREEFEKKLKEEKLEELVNIYGTVTDRAKIKSFFLEADVLVLPTYYPVEAQPLSIIEAFNAATPVISTYHASIPDMIAEGKNGFLIQARSPKEIADRIETLFEFSSWHQMACNARKSYLETYQRNITLPKLLEIFKS